MSKARSIIFCVLSGLTYFVTAVFVSMPPPFYAAEARNKGLTPSQVSMKTM